MAYKINFTTEPEQSGPSETDSVISADGSVKMIAVTIAKKYRDTHKLDVNKTKELKNKISTFLTGHNKLNKLTEISKNKEERNKFADHIYNALGSVVFDGGDKPEEQLTKAVDQYLNVPIENNIEGSLAAALAYKIEGNKDDLKLIFARLLDQYQYKDKVKEIIKQNKSLIETFAEQTYEEIETYADDLTRDDDCDAGICQ